MRTTILAVALLATTAAVAQSVGNPPGNTLAPATGTATTASGPPPAAPVGDLPARTPAQVAAEKYKTEIVCKTTIQTGSLIAKRKNCLTRKQWQYVDDENQRFVHRLQEDNAGKSAGFAGGPN